MGAEKVEPKKTESVIEELNRIQAEIRRRAYEFFSTQRDLWGGPLDDWLKAEREVIWRPAVELRQQDGTIHLSAAVAGVDPKQLDIRVSPEDILITADVDHRHETQEGTVHLCEFERGRLFRSVHLPEPIDPDSVKAECRDGLLRLTAAVAKVAPKKVDVHAA
jgi:HSP20 family protein